MSTEKNNPNPIILEDGLYNQFILSESEVNAATTAKEAAENNLKKLQHHFKGNSENDPDVKKMFDAANIEILRAQKRLDEYSNKLKDVSQRIKKIVQDAKETPVIWRIFQEPSFVSGFPAGGYTTKTITLEGGEIKMTDTNTPF